MKEKITKKKTADKKKDDDKSKRKEDKFKPDITIIHYYYVFDSALNTNALPEAFKRITDLMSFVKALINSKVTVNKTIIPFSFWKIIIDFRVIKHIFFNKSFIFNFKSISFYVETESGELLWCSNCSKIKIDLKGSNGNIDVVVKNIIWCPDLDHNLLSTIPLSQQEVEIFLQIDDRSSEFWKNDNIFNYADIINDQYVIWGNAYQMNQVNVIVSPQLLHQWMGYLNWQSVMQVPNHVTSINLQSKKSEEICEDCMLGHQQKKIDHASIFKATELFQLIYTDFNDPYPST